MSSRSLELTAGAQARIDDRVQRIETQLELLSELLGVPDGGARATGAAETSPEPAAASEPGGRAR
jgi:hypothetical protein